MNTKEETHGKPTRVSQMSAWHHECEWTSEADVETDLHLRYTFCQKNPGHKNFIPIGQFSIDHLPPDYPDEDIVEWTKLTADLTVKVCVRYVSVDRPETFPNTERGKHIPRYEDKVGESYPFCNYKGSNITRAGTACVWNVLRFKGQCKSEVNCSYKNGGEVELHTARHVVYDDSEAEKTQLIFFYDSEEDQEKKRNEWARRVKLCSTERDVCLISFYSHDLEFLDKLEDMVNQRDILEKKLKRKYFQHHSPLSHLPVIIVSHPHGCSKVVTMGHCTEMLVKEEVLEEEVKFHHVVYGYTADTCPGSSGAQVLLVNKRGWKFGLFTSTPHSASLDSGVNMSAAAWWWW